MKEYDVPPNLPPDPDRIFFRAFRQRESSLLQVNATVVEDGPYAVLLETFGPTRTVSMIALNPNGAVFLIETLLDFLKEVEPERIPELEI